MITISENTPGHMCRQWHEKQLLKQDQEGQARYLNVMPVTKIRLFIRKTSEAYIDEHIYKTF